MEGGRSERGSTAVAARAGVGAAACNGVQAAIRSSIRWPAGGVVAYIWWVIILSTPGPALGEGAEGAR